MTFLMSFKENDVPPTEEERDSFENELCILYGDTSSGKSILAMQIADAISSPQAIQVLDKALTGMNVTLQDLNAGKKGQVYANYRFPSNGKTFRVSLSPASTALPELRNAQAPKLAYLETKNGVYIISVSGDISSEQKSQILRNANFSFNKLN